MGLQTKWGVWPSKLTDGFSKVFSAGALKNLFSVKKLTDLGQSLVKLVTIGAAVWWAFSSQMPLFPQMLWAPQELQFSLLFQPLINGAVKVLGAMALVAGIDFALQKSRFKENMKMTKQEVKRENKDEEGDPKLKGRRMKRHRDLVTNQVAQAVPMADVLVVNPTHFAVALRYRPGECPAPMLTAKGVDRLALFMRELARTNGVPIVENKPLARLLYRSVKVGRSVPEETYQAVAAVLAFVSKVTGKNYIQGVSAPLNSRGSQKSHSHGEPLL